MIPITKETMALAGILILVGSTLFFASADQRTTGDNRNVPTKTKLHLMGERDAAAGTLYFKATKTIPAGYEFALDVDGNVVSEPREQTDTREAAGIDLWYHRNRDFLTPHYSFPFSDFGTFAAVTPNPSSDDLAVGLRASPFRLLYGTTAPDFLVAQHYVGLGVSFYAPPDVMGKAFSHWGIGVGHLWPVGDHPDDRRTTIYLSFTTFIP
jgi:hypothetical protein